MLTQVRRNALAREVAALPMLPRQRVGPKSWRTRRQHMRIVRLGRPSQPVFLKSYSTGQCEWGLDRVEYGILESLRHMSATEKSFRVPEPICFLPDHHVIATTVVPGKVLHYPMLFYGFTGIRTSKLIDWSRKLGAGIAELWRLSTSLNLPELPKKELSAVAVQQKAPGIRVLVDSGLDKLVAEKGHLLDQTPQALAHGDLSARNILVYKDRFSLIDWGYASIRSIFHDPLHLARSFVFSQGQGMARNTALAMAKELLVSWFHAADLTFSPEERSSILRLELCRSYCADGVDERIVNICPELAAELVSLVCTLEI
jgi:hypothetical protein